MAWFKGRRSSNDLRSPSGGSKTIISAPSLPQHSWSAFNSSASIASPDSPDGDESEAAVRDVLISSPPPPSAQKKMASMMGNQFKQNDLVGAAESKVLKSCGLKIAAADQELKNQRIMVASEHYFRLALESYEQLKAVHYRASQEFSLAEWLHIHALLLYGKIQSVQKALKMGSFAQHNQIDLSSDILVFGPVATALNAVGTVKDQETGVVYIPDAHFPKVSKDTMESAMELQQILNGTLYDWQRSWMRVAEARSERDSRDTKFAMTRSSSQLISAIQEATEKVGRAKQDGRFMRSMPDLTEDDSFEHEKDSDSSFDSEYSGCDFVMSEEEQLNVLFEEARNAKDYTIRPPCDHLYNEIHPAIIPVYLQPENIKEQAAAAKRRSIMRDHSLAQKKGLIPGLAIDTKDSQLESLALEFSVGAGNTSGAKVEKEKSPVQPENFTYESQSGLITPEEQQKGGNGAQQRDVDSSPCPKPRSALRKPPQLRISDAKPYQSLPSPSTLAARGSSETLAASTTSSKLRGTHVTIGGSSELKQFVQYDSQLWQDYTKFVNALREPNLASFRPLKNTGEGTYAWMLPVRVGNVGEKRAIQLQLPRKSVPMEDQALAMILQTSCPSQELLQSWHISMTAEVSLKTLLTEYVESAVNARF